ncbi:MAG: hypothetical protein GY804_05905 [Alphaproteobacteria bacterium]|nr:hypothetical protein [Alphaproteobacteria bacterium]
MRIDKVNQFGRSMMEMLGVLAIIGVLSVGALAGYSMAMSCYKAGKAVDEIKGYVIGIKDLRGANGGDWRDYANSDLLSRAGVFPVDGKNMFGGGVSVGSATLGLNGSEYHPLWIIYRLDDEEACKNILLADWQREIENLIKIGAEKSGFPPSSLEWRRCDFLLCNGSDLDFPITVDQVQDACEDIKSIDFQIL